jgi:hypothetical protein
VRFATARDLTKLSTSAEHGTRRQTGDAGDEDDRLIEAIRAATVGPYPHIAAIGMELMSGTGPDRVIWGFHCRINGFLVTPRPDQSYRTILSMSWS